MRNNGYNGENQRERAGSDQNFEIRKETEYGADAAGSGPRYSREEGRSEARYTETGTRIGTRYSVNEGKRESRYQTGGDRRALRRSRSARLTGQVLAVCVLLSAVAVITVFLPGWGRNTVSQQPGGENHSSQVVQGDEVKADSASLYQDIGAEESGGQPIHGVETGAEGSDGNEIEAGAEIGAEDGDGNETEVGAETGTGNETDEWKLLLVNRDHPLPEDYQVELVRLSNGQSVDSRIYPALQKMFDDARASGIYPIVASGYRTTQDQQRIMDEKIQEFIAQGYSQEEAKQEALNWVAVPGTSEHQLGFAVDINADGINSYGDQVYQWLNENGWRYGFIQRYPSDKTEITGISYEPWHYRYVGEEAAKEIYDQGVCLEEYLGAA